MSVLKIGAGAGANRAAPDWTQGGSQAENSQKSSAGNFIAGREKISVRHERIRATRHLGIMRHLARNSSESSVVREQFEE